jgi:hypothetical protein
MSAVPTMGKTRYRPVRDTICPPTVEVTMRPAISGRISKPDFVGLAPRTTWK